MCYVLYNDSLNDFYANISFWQKIHDDDDDDDGDLIEKDPRPMSSKSRYNLRVSFKIPGINGVYQLLSHLNNFLFPRWNIHMNIIPLSIYKVDLTLTVQCTSNNELIYWEFSEWNLIYYIH